MRDRVRHVLQNDRKPSTRKELYQAQATAWGSEELGSAEDYKYSVSGEIQGTREECLKVDVACPCGRNAMTCGEVQDLPRLQSKQST